MRFCYEAKILKIAVTCKRNGDFVSWCAAVHGKARQGICQASVRQDVYLFITLRVLFPFFSIIMHCRAASADGSCVPFKV